MAVDAKVSWVGLTFKPGADGSDPPNCTVAVVVVLVALTVRVPVSGLDCVGAKTTPVVQLAPAARLVPQVFPKRLKGLAMAKLRPTAGDPPEFVIVTVCAALVCPMAVAASANCAGAVPS